MKIYCFYLELWKVCNVSSDDYEGSDGDNGDSDNDVFGDDDDDDGAMEILSMAPPIPVLRQ